MTLGFSTHWGLGMGDLTGTPTYFIDKIWEGLKSDDCLGDVRSIIEIQKYSNEYMKKFGEHWDSFSHDAWTYDQLHNCETTPKIHTIRKGNRWKEGMKIHMVIHNRTKKRFQFAPVIECTKVDNIEINHWWYDEEKTTSNFPTVKINGKSLEWKDIEKLAENDGFPSVDSFFDFFNEDFEGQIIHWTDLRY